MDFFALIPSFICTYLTPFMLFLSSAAVLSESGFFSRLSPKNLFSALRSKKSDGTSPLRALSLSLAGTLGVGNITGVASAVVMGGAGAVFWMWAGALAVIPVKYAETYLAVRFRRSGKHGYYGGAMYYITDGLGRHSPRLAATLGAVFAVLCALNSLVTGNIVQANAAACVFDAEYRPICGIALAVLVLFAIIYGTDRISRITSAVIPPLCVLYVSISLVIILSNITLVPSVVSEIIKSAFSARALAGGAAGFSVREAARYGVIRGIFSNEAGCGTSPTAHASADADSPHSQACLGVVEVAADTLVLCTLTALVLLIAEKKCAFIPWHENTDVTHTALGAFSSLAGSGVYFILVGAIFLFAYSTLIAQFYYGTVAVGYLTDRKIPRVIYTVMSVLCPVVGSVISAPAMWYIADTLIGIMTAVNCAVIIVLSHFVRPSPLR